VSERRFIVTLRSLPATAPIDVRLRRGLKYLLRACQLRAIRVEETSVNEKDPAPRAGEVAGGTTHAGSI